MSDADLIAAVEVVDPRALAKARRLACALLLIRQGMNRREIVHALRGRFCVERLEAWRVMSVAWDMAGLPDDEKPERRKVDR